MAIKSKNKNIINIVEMKYFSCITEAAATILTYFVATWKLKEIIFNLFIFEVGVYYQSTVISY